jgi:hypothetical protein
MQDFDITLPRRPSLMATGEKENASQSGMIVMSEINATFDPSQSASQQSTSMENDKMTKKKSKKSLAQLENMTLQKAIADLRVAAAPIQIKKGKFPPELKLPLVECARVAMTAFGGEWVYLHDEEQKLFWNHVREIFPFQIGTLKVPLHIRFQLNKITRIRYSIASLLDFLRQGWRNFVNFQFNELDLMRFFILFRRCFPK